MCRAASQQGSGMKPSSLRAALFILQYSMYCFKPSWVIPCWRRPFEIRDAMNLIWLCHTHSLAFDSHQFGLCLGGLDNSIRFCSFSDEYNDLVQSANERLQDTSQPFFDMSYVSRRAVGMRLYKAQQGGHYFNHDDPDAWQTVGRLSNAASLNDGEDDTER